MGGEVNNLATGLHIVLVRSPVFVFAFNSQIALRVRLSNSLLFNKLFTGQYNTKGYGTITDVI